MPRPSRPRTPAPRDTASAPFRGLLDILTFRHRPLPVADSDLAVRTNRWRKPSRPIHAVRTIVPGHPRRTASKPRAHPRGRRHASIRSRYPNGSWACSWCAACGRPRGRAVAGRSRGRTVVEPTSFRQGERPSLEGGLGWLNSAPIRLEELRGKVVLLDFWTYCCINCHHVLPDLAKLEEKYKNELVVIGVHTPKFFAEHDTENIRKQGPRVPDQAPGRQRRRPGHLEPLRRQELADAGADRPRAARSSARSAARATTRVLDQRHRRAGRAGTGHGAT